MSLPGLKSSSAPLRGRSLLNPCLAGDAIFNQAIAHFIQSSCIWRLSAVSLGLSGGGAGVRLKKA